MPDADSFIQSVTVDASRKGLSPGEISNHIRERGLCIVKNCLPPTDLSALSMEFQKWCLATRNDNADGRHDFVLQNGLTTPNLPGFSERLVTLVGGSAFADIARQYFGCARENLVIPQNHMLLRIRDAYINAMFLAANITHGFHQDYALIPQSFPLNMWIPLSRIDKNCDGLSFVLPFTGAIYDNPFDVHKMLDETKSYVITPELDVGDVILFNHKTLHGSFIIPQPVNPRYSVEFRIGSDMILQPGYTDMLSRFPDIQPHTAAPALKRLWQLFRPQS